MRQKYARRLLALACAVVFSSASATDPDIPSSAFVEGKDYVRLSTPVAPSTQNSKEVVELFWYGCPHCYELESQTQVWLKRKPSEVVFVRVPVVLNPNWEAGARAYYAAEALGVLEKTHQPVFEAIHKTKRALRTEDDFATFFAEHGVDQEAFRKAYRSFQTETQLKRADQLAKRYRVSGVPAVFINGQYEVKSHRPFDVVDVLLNKPAP